MKQLNITIHPFSAIAGMALLGLVWVTAGAMPLQGSSSTRDVSAIENVNEPHPRDYVRIDAATPFTVPAGKLFHLTGLGQMDDTGSQTSLGVDGQIVLRCLQLSSGTDSCTIKDTPAGIVAQPGSVLSVSQGGSPAALGYLVDA